MKKILLSTATIAIIMMQVSCNKETKNTAKEETATEKVVTTKKEAEEVKETGAPAFDSKEVQEYVKAYDAYIEEYKKAAESKDMNAFAALGQKGQELATKSQELNGKISAEDAQRLGAYMAEKATLIQEYSKKMMN